jgi:hypothetical protein
MLRVPDCQDAFPRGGFRSRRDCILNNGGCLFHVAENGQANGKRPDYEATKLSTVAGYAEQLDEAARIYNVDPRLLRSIMHMEETHGYYDEPFRWFDRNSSIRPMNINTKYWGDTFGTRHELRYAEVNIRAGANLLSRIVANMPKDASVAQIATVYNDLHANKVNDYGARVSAIYDEQPWMNGEQR